MSDVKLFSLKAKPVREIPGQEVVLEKSLQLLIERNLESFLGVRFLASEYSTGPKHGGRIDTLGIDENQSPVIIEYKRATNENVINQGLFYLDWLMDHKAEFQILVMNHLGNEEAQKIEWSSPRLLCIAGGYTKFDEHAVKQMDRNIDLIRFRSFGDELLLLELVNATSASSASGGVGGKGGGKGNKYKHIAQTLEEIEGPLKDLYEELRAFLLALGDDVQDKVLLFYVAFKRIKNFACVELRPSAGAVLVYLKVDPKQIKTEAGYSRDVSKIGHFGTGDLELTIRSRKDLEKAKALLLQSYEES